MPGVNAIINLSKSKIDPDIDISRALAKMKFDRSYIDQVLFKDNDIKIVFSGYKEYPLQKFDLGNKVIIIDGAIYGKKYDEINDRLSQLLPDFINNKKGDIDALANLIYPPTANLRSILLINKHRL